MHGHGSHKTKSKSSFLLGGKNPSEGDVMAMNSHMVFGPVCDVSFGYNEACIIKI